MGSLRLVAIVLLLGSPAFAQSSLTYGVGRAPTAEEIRALDISIAPTGDELPAGHGTAKEGVKLFEQKGCIGCHGPAGLGGLAPSLQSKKRPGCSDLGAGTHTAAARAVCDDRVGFHPSRHAARE
jgi:hypothetical protein